MWLKNIQQRLFMSHYTVSELPGLFLKNMDFGDPKQLCSALSDVIKYREEGMRRC